MTEPAFSDQARKIVGPVLCKFGFELYGVDDHVKGDDRDASVLFYRSDDCKVQIYWSARAGEINCMIGLLDAPEFHGLYDKSRKWHYLNELSAGPIFRWKNWSVCYAVNGGHVLDGGVAHLDHQRA